MSDSKKSRLPKISKKSAMKPWRKFLVSFGFGVSLIGALIVVLAISRKDKCLEEERYWPTVCINTWTF
jgi:hypothetical protein